MPKLCKKKFIEMTFAEKIHEIRTRYKEHQFSHEVYHSLIQQTIRNHRILSKIEAERKLQRGEKNV